MIFCKPQSPSGLDHCASQWMVRNCAKIPQVCQNFGLCHNGIWMYTGACRHLCPDTALLSWTLTPMAHHCWHVSHDKCLSMPLNKTWMCINPPILTFPMESDCFSTSTALFSTEEAAAAHFSRLHHKIIGPAGSTSGKAHRAPQKQHHSLPTNNPTKTHAISWCCCYCQDFQACSFPGEICGMHTLQTVLHLIWVAWFQAAIKAVGAPIFSLRAHLRQVQVKVNQWQSLLLQLCKGEHLPVAAPTQKQDAEGLLLRCREVAAKILLLLCQAPCTGPKRACCCARKWVIQAERQLMGLRIFARQLAAETHFAAANITLHWWGGESFQVSP